MNILNRLLTIFIFAVVVLNAACGPISAPNKSETTSNNPPSAGDGSGRNGRGGNQGGGTDPAGVKPPFAGTGPVVVAAPPVVVPPPVVVAHPVVVPPPVVVAHPVVVPPPVVVAPVPAYTQGIFAYERKASGANFIIRYLQNNNNISRDDFISLLLAANANGKDFREVLNKSIADLPPPGPGFAGYEIKGPVINVAAKNYPFYFVALKKHGLGSGSATYANYLYNCNPQPVGANKNVEFNNRFKGFYAALLPTNFVMENAASGILHNYGAAVFSGGMPANHKEILISPCPAHANMGSPHNSFLGHIYSFTQELQNNGTAHNNLRLHSFWYAVGKQARVMFDGNNVIDGAGNPETKLFLSTHGSGIYYLHFRLENNPPPYNYQANVNALLNVVPSENYFRALFP